MADFLERISSLSPKKLALLANDLKERFDSLEQERREPIAIIGMGCRFPGGADSPAKFWRLLHDGVDAISEVPPERWDLDSIYDPEPGKPGKIGSRYGGFLKDVDRFDPAFFGISPREATSMDPQQRLLLEVVWEALEDAGQSPEQLSETQTGVFVGIAGSDYLHGMLQSDPRELDMYVATGGAHSTASGRISYILGLRGPSVSIDTACSSSLVAVHLACQSLRTKESKIAIAVGVNLILKPEVSISLSRSQMLAPDGRCKAFDAAGDGFVRSEGCGVVVLKRLSDAVANRDCILALVRGTAVNQDGRSSGLTAPNGPSQEAVIQAALAAAGVEPAAVDYIETHGSGTSLGDPIEVRALGNVFSPNRDSLSPLTIGSVKTNLGHLETAAGIAGLIKAVLALQNEEIPPSLHFKNPSPHIAWGQLPIRVAAKPAPWKRGSRRRLAGVSSFGFSGTNVHAILEEAPQQAAPNEQPDQQKDRPAHIYAVSAKSEAVLLENVKRHLAGLRTESSLANACFTANTGRTHFAHRLACVCHSQEELVEQLEAFVQGELAPGVFSGQMRSSAATEVAFLFPGQGAQFPGMTRRLYQSQAVFRSALDRCAQALEGVLKKPLLEVIFSGDEETAIHDPEYAQPANFAVEYAASEMWRSWGVTPSAVVGHSLGEFAAACVAGICDPVEAIRLVATRGRLMQELPPNGAMAAVYAPEKWVDAKLAELGEKTWICAMNHPEQTVISGPHVNVEKALNFLGAQGVKVEWLRAYHGYHSREMQPMVEQLVRAAGKVQYRIPQLQFVSTLTGKPLPMGETLDADYWGRQVVEPVRFVAAVESLRELHYNVFLDTGPAPVLGGNGRHCFPEGTWLATLRPSREDWDQILEALSGLYVAGAAVDWEAFDRSYQRQRIALPTYAFDRQSYWILEPDQQQTTRRRAARAGATVHPLLGVRLDHPIPTYETSVDRMCIPGLGAHKIGLTEVVPGPVYFEMALAAAFHALGTGRYQLEDLVLQEALLFDSSEQTIQAVVTQDADETGVFQLCSRNNGSDAGLWRRHAVAHLRAATAIPPGDQKLEQARERCAEPVSLDSLRVQLQTLAVEIPALDFVDGAWKGSSEVLTHLSLGAEQAEKGSGYHFDPVAVDAALLSFAVLLSAESDGAPEGSYFLAGVDQVVVHEQPGDKLWSHARLTASEDGPAKSRTGDLFLYSETGQPVAVLLGLHFHRASKATQAIAQPDERLEEDWLYHLEWERTLTQPRSASAQDAATPWIVFAGADDAGRAISDALLRHGLVRAVVSPGEAYSAEGIHYTVNSRSVRDFERVIREASDGAPCWIAFLWGLGTGAFSADGGVLGAATDVCSSVSRLVEGAAAAKTGAKIWLVTQGAQAMGNTGRPLACVQSALWGLGRAAALEESDLWGGLIDLDPEKRPEEQAGWILGNAACADGEDQVAVRDGVRFAARLTRLSGMPHARVAIEPEGSYLVTGGLGAVGVKIARWLVERGARHVVLVGRRGLPERSSWADVDPESANGRSVAAVNALEARGAKIEVVAADLSDRSCVEKLFTNFGREWPELRGLVHAAVAAPDERRVRDLDETALKEMLSVKVDGTQNLLEMAASQPVGFIVFFSSMAALLGLSGGGHYAAASAYLDALAHNCRRSGVPVTSINWGAWDELRSSTGEIRALARTANASIYPLDPPKALATMEAVVAAGLPQAAIAAIHWENLRSLHESERPRLLIQGLTSASKGASVLARDAGAGDLRARLSAASESERSGILESFVRGSVARVLGIRNPQSIDAHKGLFAMGLDSLMSIDLKTRLANGVGHSLPSTLAFNYPSIAALTEFLVQDMFPAAGKEHSVAEPVPSSQTNPEVNGGDVAEMSEEELAEQLRKRLAQLAGVES